jgi:hypothetical protein
VGRKFLCFALGLLQLGRRTLRYQRGPGGSGCLAGVGPGLGPGAGPVPSVGPPTRTEDGGQAAQRSRPPFAAARGRAGLCALCSSLLPRRRRRRRQQRPQLRAPRAPRRAAPPRSHAELPTAASALRFVEPAQSDRRRPLAAPHPCLPVAAGLAAWDPARSPEVGAGVGWEGLLGGMEQSESLLVGLGE